MDLVGRVCFRFSSKNIYSFFLIKKSLVGLSKEEENSIYIYIYERHINYSFCKICYEELKKLLK